MNFKSYFKTMNMRCGEDHDVLDCSPLSGALKFQLNLQIFIYDEHKLKRDIFIYSITINRCLDS